MGLHNSPGSQKAGKEGRVLSKVSKRVIYGFDLLSGKGRQPCAKYING